MVEQPLCSKPRKMTPALINLIGPRVRFLSRSVLPLEPLFNTLMSSEVQRMHQL